LTGFDGVLVDVSGLGIRAAQSRQTENSKKKEKAAKAGSWKEAGGTVKKG